MDQFNEDFASHWDELVGWGNDSFKNIDFIKEILNRYNCKKILDVALGTGFHSVNLSTSGFDITAVDISEAMIMTAERNALNYKTKFKIICSDWVDLENKLEDKYDCIICLGNSLACENDLDKRRKSIANWIKLLKKNGIILVDRRNYELLLLGKDITKERTMYFGKEVKIIAEKVQKNDTVFSYEFKDGKKFKLRMHPITHNQMQNLFNQRELELVKVYKNYHSTFNEADTNVFHYIYKKK